jgi:hypothetical protein
MKPIWKQLKDEGYKVVIVDVDTKREYGTSRILPAEYTEHRVTSVPTTFWYNSNTKTVLRKQEGTISKHRATSNLWKKSLSKASRRVRPLSFFVPRIWHSHYDGALLNRC